MIPSKLKFNNYNKFVLRKGTDWILIYITKNKIISNGTDLVGCGQVKPI